MMTVTGNKYSKHAALLCILVGILWGAPVFADANKADAAQPDDKGGLRSVFAFTGHLRGAQNFVLHPLLGALARELRVVRADFLAIGGDTICGYKTAYDEAAIEREWRMVDEALGDLEMPVYRVVGNYDWHSTETARVFRRLYGPEYFEARSKGLRIVGLSNTRLLEDRSIDWKELWSSPQFLPNDSVLPEGKQKVFWKEVMRDIAGDASAKAVVLLVGSPVWSDEGTSEVWWKEYHPALEALDRPVVVLCGEVQPPERSYQQAGKVHYVTSALGIMDPDERFSVAQGTYLQVAFWGDEYRPEFFVRVIGLNAENRPILIRAIPADTDAYMKTAARILQGEPVSALNRLRTKFKSWCLERQHWYDRTSNIRTALVASGVFVLVLLTGVLWGLRMKCKK